MNAAKFMMVVVAGTILMLCLAFATAHALCYFMGGC